MRNRTSFTSQPTSTTLTSLVRHHHARQHIRGRDAATHPVMRAWDRKPHFLSAVQAGTLQSPYRRCTVGGRPWRFTQYPTRATLRPPKTTQYI